MNLLTRSSVTQLQYSTDGILRAPPTASASAVVLLRRNGLLIGLQVSLQSPENSEQRMFAEAAQTSVSETPFAFAMGTRSKSAGGPEVH